jgi:EAL domain-containing protein (putative c-di-GMP-specific phosphodiesterase class I)/CheY-like chemotaxis protein/GGDEF domain-containing protein
MNTAPARQDRTVPPILVVEDDAPSRTLLVRRLRREGWEVEEAADGGDALDILARTPISAVLLDIGLPGMNGLAVLKAIRRRRTAVELPVIMITAFDKHEYLSPALEAGANDFVDKPVDFSILRARLRTHLGLSAAVTEAAELRERQALIIKGSNDGIWEWSLRGNRLFHSARWRDLLDIPPGEPLRRSEDWLRRIHPDDVRRVQDEFIRFCENPQAEYFRCEYRVKTGNDDYLWVQTRGASWRDDAGTCVRAAGTHTDISALRYVHRFTGLPNLQRLTDILARQLERARRTQSGVGVVLFRLRDPERQTARMGTRHAYIRELADTLNGHLRPFDIIGSGEHAEHLIMLPGQPLASIDELSNMARRVRDIACADIGAGEPRPKFQITSGLAFFAGHDAPSAEEVIASALLAAEVAHERGLPQLCFDTPLRERIERRQRLAGELIDAIDNDAITPWWQPIVRADGRLAGFETLARWNGADGTPVTPAEFIPLAESAGLLHRLTERMLERSLAALAGWMDSNHVDGDAYVAVNVPASLLDDQALPGHLHALIGTYGLQPASLCIEITESAAVNDTPETRERLQRLRRDGFRLALDDFGTGYASLSMLHRLPFDTIKIDQSFVRVMHAQTNAHELVHAIIAMARALDLELVAEGVETEQQATSLRSAGVDRLQGYLLARPMPEHMLLDWLRRRSDSSETLA